MNLNFTGGILPSRATTLSAGYDLFAPTDVCIWPGCQELIKLGISWKPDVWEGPAIFGGFFAKIWDKSGHAVKSRFNTRAGVIDMDYPKEWGVVCVNEGPTVFRLEASKSLAQFVLLPFLLADDLSTSSVVRAGGFGSTSL